MGLFDQLAGQALNSIGGNEDGDNQSNVVSQVLPMISGLIQNQGGVSGLLQSFQNAGLSDQVASWVGNGNNEAVDGGQITQALGSGVIGEFANKLGVSDEEASGTLASILPGVINQLTPNGEVDEQSEQASGDLVSQGLSMLGSFLNK